VLFNKVEALEQKAEIRDAERDRIIRIETKLESMKERMSELKSAQSDNTERLRGLEDSVKDNFRELMKELRRQGESRNG